MASEKNVSKIIKELGYEPKEHACIVVNYAPDDSLGSKLSHFLLWNITLCNCVKKKLSLFPSGLSFLQVCFPRKKLH